MYWSRPISTGKSKILTIKFYIYSVLVLSRDEKDSDLLVTLALLAKFQARCYNTVVTIHVCIVPVEFLTGI